MLLIDRRQHSIDDQTIEEGATRIKTAVAPGQQEKNEEDMVRSALHQNSTVRVAEGKNASMLVRFPVVLSK